MKTRLHKFAALLSMFIISLFLIATLSAELLGDHADILVVKQAIVFPGLFVLVPAIALTGISGMLLGRRHLGNPLVQQKKSRMPLIAIIGLLILIPLAISLNILAQQGDFNSMFMVLQVIEILAGFTNLTLMWRNFRAGQRLVKARKEGLTASS